jgi:hypothetical protein
MEKGHFIPMKRGQRGPLLTPGRDRDLCSPVGQQEAARSHGTPHRLSGGSEEVQVYGRIGCPLPGVTTSLVNRMAGEAEITGLKTYFKSSL